MKTFCWAGWRNEAEKSGGVGKDKAYDHLVNFTHEFDGYFSFVRGRTCLALLSTYITFS